MAIEEREKWKEREKEILEKLEKIRARKKKYQKRAKKLKENIKEIEDALRAAKRDELDRVRVSDRIDEHLMR
ncbi:MAG: hypothetical protein R6W73_10195 [Candidatus Saliniplasma sp.]